MKKAVVFSADAPKAIGPYSQALSFGELVFCSGQLGVDTATGKLAQGVDAQTHAAMKNLGAVLAAAGLGYQDILKTTIFVTDLKDFAAVNQAYGSYFASEPPARACVQVAALPLGGLVEVECVAARQAD